MGYLNKYRLLHEGQSGFRQKHSCQTALIKLIDHWIEYIDKGDLVGTLFVDFRKAFDLVNHSILLEKLNLYKFSHSAIRWFESYLSSRQQAIAYNNSLSHFAHVRTGVPQGSIIGPTLFLIFINDLPLSLKNCKSDLYADDATFHTHHKDLLVIENELQTTFDKTKLWAKDHKMEIHDIKTSCMAVGSRKRISQPHNIHIKSGDIPLRNVTNQKLLGVYIDENLSWSTHIDHLCSQVASKISLLCQLSQYVPTETQKKFYQGYILPLLDYGSVTWGTSSAMNIERLLKLQKRAARIILKTDLNTPSADMFKELGWLPLRKRIDYNKAVLTYKALNNMAPEYITNLLTPMSQAHSLNLRSAVNGTLYVPKSRTSLFDGTFTSSAPKLWNSLPLGVRNADSLNSFKKAVKEVL